MEKEASEERHIIYISMTRPRYGKIPVITPIQHRNMKRRVEVTWMFTRKEYKNNKKHDVSVD